MAAVDKDEVAPLLVTYWLSVDGKLGLELCTSLVDVGAVIVNIDHCDVVSLCTAC